jgi:hypothetical protein
MGGFGNSSLGVELWSEATGLGTLPSNPNNIWWLPSDNLSLSIISPMYAL